MGITWDYLSHSKNPENCESMLETNSLRFTEYIDGSTAQQLSPDVFFFAYGVWYSTVLLFVLVWFFFVSAFVLIVLIFLVTALYSIGNKYLVGGFNPSEKYSSKWESSPNRGEHKKYLKPPPSY